jgi:hypothetical protein
MIWQLLEIVVNFNMATHGNLWQLLQNIGKFWKILATFG